jgi:hypothetical protein
MGTDEEDLGCRRVFNHEMHEISLRGFRKSGGNVGQKIFCHSGECWNKSGGVFVAVGGRCSIAADVGGRMVDG